MAEAFLWRNLNQVFTTYLQGRLGKERSRMFNSGREAFPFTKTYNRRISDVGLTKKKKKRQIPTPRGFWQGPSKTPRCIVTIISYQDVLHYLFTCVSSTKCKLLEGASYVAITCVSFMLSTESDSLKSFVE